MRTLIVMLTVATALVVGTTAASASTTMTHDGITATVHGRPAMTHDMTHD